VPRASAAASSPPQPWALLLAGGLFAWAPSYLGKTADLFAGDYRFRLRAEYSSVFGDLKVVEFADRNDPSRYVILFLTDGLVQNKLLPDAAPTASTPYMLEALGAAYAPDAQRVLVLGLGAGAVPRALAERGFTVDGRRDQSGHAGGRAHACRARVRLDRVYRRRPHLCARLPAAL